MNKINIFGTSFACAYIEGQSPQNAVLTMWLIQNTHMLNLGWFCVKKEAQPTLQSQKLRSCNILQAHVSVTMVLPKSKQGH